MRISVMAGLFACAVIFVANSANAEAATPNNLETTSSSTITTIKRMEEVTEIARSPLLTLAEKSEDNVIPVDVKTADPIKYLVGESETLSTIAEKYNTTWKRIYDKNTNIETPDVINPGEEIIIPAVDETLVERELPAVVQAVKVEKPSTPSAPSSTVASVTPKASSGGNGYVAGYCTWYVKSRRPDLPNSLGNAYAWISNAAAQGLSTGSAPRVGAAAQRNNHVAYVEAINSDGTITISDMNYRARFATTTRVVNPAEWRYIY